MSDASSPDPSAPLRSRDGEPASLDRLLKSSIIGGSRQAPPTVSPALQSAGELENDEHTAAVMMQMVRTASRFRLPGTADPPFKRMSGKTHAHAHASPTHRLTCLSRVHSHPGRLRLRGDGFCSEGLCCQTSEQPAANQGLDRPPGSGGVDGHVRSSSSRLQDRRNTVVPEETAPPGGGFYSETLSQLLPVCSINTSCFLLKVQLVSSSFTRLFLTQTKTVQEGQTLVLSSR